MNFLIDTFHFFNKKLLSELKESNNSRHVLIDWEIILKLRQKDFSQHDFIIIDNSKVLYCSPDLNDKIQIKTDDYNLFFSINKIDKPIYIIEIQSTEHNIEIELIKNENIVHANTIFHETIICKKGHSLLTINSHSPLNYYNLTNNFANELFHQELSFCLHQKTNIYLAQKQEKSKIKFDCQINLHSTSEVFVHSLVYLQEGQLRDDAIEIIHHNEDTKSDVSYFSLNSGKSVSQINSVVKSEASNSEVNQSIKHILLTESGQSYSRPNLMISNPLVVASHGNSIGSFNTENLFYLKQKGLSEASAKKMISYSYITHFCDNSSYSEQLQQYFIGGNDD